MKTVSRFILISSLAGNLALWGALRWTQPGADAAAKRAPAVQIPDGAQNSSKGAVPPRESRDAWVGETAKRTGSSWNDLRSDHLPTFVARLRAAGFPPDVVRAMVMSTVNERFSAQLEQLLGDDERSFWQTGLASGHDPEKRAALSRLTREREQLLAELLGSDAAPDDEWTRVYQRRRYGDLPPEKMQRLQALLSDYNELRAQLRPGNRPVTEADARAQAAFEQELRTDLAKLLTPQELEQYDLRNSPTASQLRHRLDAFRPSEVEYKTVFALQRALEEQFPAANASNPQQTAARRLAESQIQEQLKAALGPERYADYQQATNPSYTALNQVVSRLDLPLSAARDVVAVQQSISQRAQEILTSDTLTSEQQTAQMQALSREASSRISSVLTPNGLQMYQQHGGQWLLRLSRPVGGTMP